MLEQEKTIQALRDEIAALQEKHEARDAQMMSVLNDYSQVVQLLEDQRAASCAVSQQASRFVIQ